MRLVCPSCGATASADAWTNDAAVRYALEALVQLPSPVLQQVLNYLALFRKGKSALPWKRVLKLIRGLKELIAEGSVHVTGCETRPCTAEIWGLAMEATIEAKPSLKNHNYLSQVAWDKAANLAVRTEKNREAARQNRRREEDADPDALSNETRQGIERMKKQLGV